MIYLASPYSHEDKSVRESRFQAACKVTATLIQQRKAVFSPVVHCHPLVAFGLPIDWMFWAQFCRAHFQRCDEMYVLCIPGWEHSVGIREETWMAQEFNIPVTALHPDVSPSSESPTLSYRPGRAT